MTIRTVEEIINQLRQELANEDSELATFPQYGNLYSIYRSIANLVVEQDVKLQELDNVLFIDSSTGNYLDRKARDFNLTRKRGAKASGSVIAIGTRAVIPENTILTHASTNTQFQVLERANLNRNRVSISVESLTNTPIANLPAGTQLSSSVLPGVQFVVGNKFNPLTNTYEGDLRGGEFLESDGDFKIRISNLVSGFSTSTISSLQNAALTTKGVKKVSVIENQPSIGYITVYVDNPNQDVYRRLQNVLDRVKPVGTLVIIKSFDVLPVDFNIIVSTNRTGNLDNLRTSIRNSLNSYLNRLTPLQFITKESIAGNLLSINSIYNVEVIGPGANLQIRAKELPSLNNLTIKFI